MADRPHPLESLRVVNLSRTLTGVQAAQLFADFGADVVHVEPVGGGMLRRQPAVAMWMRGSRSVEMDLHSDRDLGVVRQMATTADVVIETFRPSVAEQLGLGYEQLAEVNPRLVYGSVTGFGRTGPLAALPGYEAAVMAKLGAFWTVSEMTRRPGPAFLSAPYCSFPASQLLAQGIFAALYEREGSGLGQRVDTTLAHGLMVHDTFGWFARIVAQRYGGYAQAPLSNDGVPNGGLSFRLLIALTADGRWLQFSQTAPRLFRAMMVAFGLEWMFDDPRWGTAPDFDDVPTRIAFWEELLAVVRSKTAAQWAEVFDAHPDVWGEVFRHGAEVLDHPQMQWNNSVIAVDDPLRGCIRQPGALIAMDLTPPMVDRCAPSLGEHTETIRDECAHVTVGDSSTARPGSGDPPLHGVTLLELGTYYAAPFGATLLAELGARVIKIEQLDGDPMRNMLPFPEIAGIKALQGKQSVAVDVATPEGRAIVLELARTADIVLQSFRAGVAARLGLDAASLRAVNPDIVYLCAPGYGTGGPNGHRPAYAPTIGAGAGLAWRNAGPTIEERPDLEMDDVKRSAMQLAYAVMGVGNADGCSAVTVGTALTLGLLARARGAGSQELLTTMLSTTAHALSETMVEYTDRSESTGGEAPVPDVGLHGFGACYRLYECADGWVFLAAPTDRDWQRLTATASHGALALDARFADAASRAVNDAALSDELQSIFRAQSSADWERELTALEIACVEVARGPVEANILDEGSIGHQIGLVAHTNHPVLDAHERLAAMVTMSRSSSVIGGGCMVGDHTSEVLREFGYDDATIDDLRSRGVIGG